MCSVRYFWLPWKSSSDSIWNSLQILDSRKHVSKEYHKETVVRVEDLRKTMLNQQPSIKCTFNTTLANRIAANYQMLALIVKTAEFCGWQNIALRDHTDNAMNVEKDILVTANHDSFLWVSELKLEM